MSPVYVVSVPFGSLSLGDALNPVNAAFVTPTQASTNAAQLAQVVQFSRPAYFVL